VARDEELTELRRERLTLQQKRDRLEERFNKEKRTLLDELRKTSRKIFEEWQAGRIGRKQAMKELAQARKAVEQPGAGGAKAASLESPARALAPGDRVKYLPWGKTGVVEAVDERKNMLKIDLDGVSMWVAPDDAAPVQASARDKGGAVLTARVSAPSSMRLDVRGKRADEALTELELFLDKALLANYASVEVVHGRGEGVLRRQVHDFLRGFPAIRSFALADEEHGGDQCTMVELK